MWHSSKILFPQTGFFVSGRSWGIRYARRTLMGTPSSGICIPLGHPCRCGVPRVGIGAVREAEGSVTETSGFKIPENLRSGVPGQWGMAAPGVAKPPRGLTTKPHSPVKSQMIDSTVQIRRCQGTSRERIPLEQSHEILKSPQKETTITSLSTPGTSLTGPPAASGLPARGGAVP